MGCSAPQGLGAGWISNFLQSWYKSAALHLRAGRANTVRGHNQGHSQYLPTLFEWQREPFSLRIYLSRFQRVKILLSSDLEGKAEKNTECAFLFAVVHRAWVEAEIWTLWCTSTCSPSKWPRPRNIWITSRNCPPSANGASKVSTQDLDNCIFASASPWKVTGLRLWQLFYEFFVRMKWWQIILKG